MGFSSSLAAGMTAHSAPIPYTFTRSGHRHPPPLANRLDDMNRA